MKNDLTLKKYRELLLEGLSCIAKDSSLGKIVDEMADARIRNANIFLAGNGGSAANANHLANDLIHCVNIQGKGSFRVHSLASNVSVITCLGNDIGYENIFSYQIQNLAVEGDIIFVFSGSGKSKNIIHALKTARFMKLKTISFLGFDGGTAKGLSDIVLHFPIFDMQVVEDLHMISAHLLVKKLQ